ncbi:transposase family protein [Nostoc sp.]|uniref:transposase family protein n=1 Tax=Nostoc sp. TaxID=1180 RepID=UPI002FF62AAB
MENILIKSGTFRLPGKRELNQGADEWKVLVVDLTETPVERPQKKQRRYYSGKKKRHTLKAQLVVDQASGKIICTSYGIGRIHDFRLLKNTQVRFHASQLAVFSR